MECLQKKLQTLLQSEEFSELKNIKVIGVMGMATFTEDTDQIEKEFQTLKSTFEDLKLLNTNLTRNYFYGNEWRL